jgi:hypothetical protein
MGLYSVNSVNKYMTMINKESYRKPNLSNKKNKFNKIKQKIKIKNK